MKLNLNVDRAFKNIGLSLSKAAGLKGLKLKEASPEILLGFGLVTMGAAVVSGIMAARHHDEIMTDHFDRLDTAKAEYIISEDQEKLEEINGAGTATPIKRSEKEIASSVRREYCRTAAAMCKLYAPTVALMAISTACFIGMHNIQAGRITALSGAYTGIKEAYEAYQRRNIELNGEENHRMCKYGYKEIEIEEVDPDNGETYKVKKKVPLDGKDMYAEEDYKHFHDQMFWFDRQTSFMYLGRGQDDLRNLRIIEQDMQQLVNSRGWAIVNDALIAMGMDPTPEGMIEGWVRGGHPVSFNLDDPINNRAMAGYREEPIFIEMNIHGNVYGELIALENKEHEMKKKIAEMK